MPGEIAAIDDYETYSGIGGRRVRVSYQLVKIVRDAVPAGCRVSMVACVRSSNRPNER